MNRLVAHYRVETALALAAAAAIAREQSSGPFVAVPGETAELRERFAAWVEQIAPLPSVEQSLLAGSRERT